MKKVMTICLSMALIVTVLFSMQASSVSAIVTWDEEYNDFIYGRVDNEAFIFEYVGDAETVVVPSEISGCKVVAIEDHAFYGCDSLKRVTLPDTLKSIGKEAFHHCDSLEEITIPESVTGIGEAAFAYCTSLKQITIPESMTEISEGTFYGCHSLKQVTLPSEITQISEGAFGQCLNLKTVYYAGDDQDWENIRIDKKSNSSLVNAERKNPNDKGGKNDKGIAADTGTASGEDMTMIIVVSGLSGFAVGVTVGVLLAVVCKKKKTSVQAKEETAVKDGQD